MNNILTFALTMVVALSFTNCKKTIIIEAPETPESFTLSKYAGDNQTGEIGKKLTNRIKVRLVNQENFGKSGVEIAFKESNGNVTKDITDTDGIAEANWTLDQQAGQQTLQAEVTTGGIVTNSVEFTATAKLRDCIREEHSFTPSAITFIPPHTGGDKDFGGNGPNVNASVRIYIEGNNVKAEIYMKAKETKSDWTTAEGSTTKTIYTAPSNRTIEAILSPLNSGGSYIDNNHNDDIFQMGYSELIKRYAFTGDTSGDEAGTKTKVVASFNAVRVRLKEIGDCE